MMERFLARLAGKDSLRRREPGVSRHTSRDLRSLKTLRRIQWAGETAESLLLTKKRVDSSELDY